MNMKTEPVRIINAIISTLGLVSSAGLVSFLDPTTSQMIVTLIVIWAATFGINATVTRNNVYSPATHEAEVLKAAA